MLLGGGRAFCRQQRESPHSSWSSTLGLGLAVLPCGEFIDERRTSSAQFVLVPVGSVALFVCAHRLICLATAAVLVQGEQAQAEVYKCVAVDGTTSYSDVACDSRADRPAADSAAGAPATPGAARNVPVVPVNSVVPVSSFDSKLHELFVRTGLSSRESPARAEIAQTLVPRVVPNLSATPHDPRMVQLGRVIEADINADMPQLARTFADADQSLVRALTSQMKEADSDAMLTFVRGPLGVSYLQFLGDMRSIYASAVQSVRGHMASQTTIPQSKVSPAVTQMRLRLIALAAGASGLFYAQDVAHNVHDPSPYAAGGILPEQIAAVAGPDVDAVAARYETALAEFESFNASAPTRHFFSSVGRPVASKMAATDAAISNFGDAELEKFGARWKVDYQRGISYMATLLGSNLAGPTGSTPQIRRAIYVATRTGRALDVTNAVQSVCQFGSGNCTVVCGNQLGGDPAFGQPKSCQITFQCGTQPTRNVSLPEGRSLTLACAP